MDMTQQSTGHRITFGRRVVAREWAMKMAQWGRTKLGRRKIKVKLKIKKEELQIISTTPNTLIIPLLLFFVNVDALCLEL